MVLFVMTDLKNNPCGLLLDGGPTHTPVDVLPLIRTVEAVQFAQLQAVQLFKRPQLPSPPCRLTRTSNACDIEGCHDNLLCVRSRPCEGGAVVVVPEMVTHANTDMRARARSSHHITHTRARACTMKPTVCQITGVH